MKYMKTKDINNKFDIKIIILILIVIIIGLLIWFYLQKSNNIEYKIILNGDKYIILNQGEQYIEPGFSAYINNQLATNKVKITSEIIENVPGLYRIIYDLDNYYEYRYIEIREVINYDLNVILNVNNQKITNNDVIININVEGDTFLSLTLPDGRIINTNNFEYNVNHNGTYKFEARNLNNEIFQKEVTIDNIDKKAPIGSCTANLLNKNTTINVKTDESNIKYYYYDSDKLLTTINKNSYTTDGKTGTIIKAILEDEAGNKTEIKCEVTDNRYYEPVVPSGNDKVVYHGDSKTLKTYIIDKKTYLMTYIWVKDAYTQLNKSASPEYGQKLYYPMELMNKAVTNNKLNDKIVVGFNASGFYLRGTYDAASVSAYPAYDKTSVGTIVINDGKVIRNAYNYAVKTWYTIGVNKDNKLLVFEDLATNNVTEKQAWSQKVISSGIRNTFTFAAPLIQNGVRTNITTSMPGGFTDAKGLQIICQVNENNFLLFTSKSETRNKALDELSKLGCQTAMNLDGGGSVAILYKDKNSSEIKRAIGGSRELPEVGYFTE